MRTILVITTLMFSTSSWASPVNATSPDVGVYERECLGTGSHCKIALRSDPLGYAADLNVRTADGTTCTEYFRLDRTDVGYRGKLTDTGGKFVTFTGTEDGLVLQADHLNTCPAALGNGMSNLNGEYKRSKTP